MIHRLEHLPPFPRPWVGAAAKDLKWMVLPLGTSEANNSELWTPVEVSFPTLAYPFRSDDLTGYADPEFLSGMLEHLQVTYSPEVPERTQEHIEAGSEPDAQQLRALPSAHNGACYLWAPGRWWIRAVCGNGGGVGFNGKIPFCLVPIPDPSWLEPMFFGRVHSIPPVTQNHSVPAVGSINILTVQEALNGLRSLRIQSGSNNIRFRWRRSTGGFFNLPTGSVIDFEGASLPLADAWLQNTGASPVTICTIQTY